MLRSIKLTFCAIGWGRFSSSKNRLLQGDLRLDTSIHLYTQNLNLCPRGIYISSINSSKKWSSVGSQWHLPMQMVSTPHSATPKVNVFHSRNEGVRVRWQTLVGFNSSDKSDTRWIKSVKIVLQNTHFASLMIVKNFMNITNIFHECSVCGCPERSLRSRSV